MEARGGGGGVKQESWEKGSFLFVLFFVFLFFFTNLSLMTNTATLNTSNKNTNNCDKLKYILRTKQKTITV